jgi:hypothetical protein
MSQPVSAAEVDLQHHLGSKLAHLNPGRLNDQPAPSRRSPLGFIVDRFAGLLRLGDGSLLVAEFPEQLQRLSGLSQDPDRLRAPHGRVRWLV